jgi:hypothetical protein
MRLEAGATGHGLDARGGATSGDGVHAIAPTAGDGMELVGAGGGFDLNADIQGSLSGSVGSVTGNVGGNVVGSVGSIAAGGITAASFAANSITASALATDAVDEIVDQTWNELIAGHLGAGSTGEALNNAGSGATPATIAAAVWNSLRASFVGAGTFGEGVASVQGNVTGNVGGNVTGSVGSVLGNVGGNLVGNVNGNVVGSVGSIAAGGITAASFAADSITATALATSAVDEIVDQTWNEILAGHLGVGTTGEALFNSGGASATDWTVAERNQIRQALGITGVTAPTTGTGTLELLDVSILAAAAGIQADTDDIQARLPATLNGGRMRSHVEACDPPCTPIAGGGGGGGDTFEGVPL